MKTITLIVLLIAGTAYSQIGHVITCNDLVKNDYDYRINETVVNRTFDFVFVAYSDDSWQFDTVIVAIKDVVTGTVEAVKKDCDPTLTGLYWGYFENYPRGKYVIIFYDKHKRFLGDSKVFEVR